MAAGHLRIGTAGWSYADWHGPFYPASRGRGFDALTFYARHFDTVEVNATYYRIPAARMVAGWVDRTPGEFRFAVKAFRDLTHGEEPGGSRTFEGFVRALKPLTQSGKLGCVLAQFPPSFRPSPTTFRYLESLSARFEGLPTVVEFRHDSWLPPQAGGEVLELLEAQGLGFANVDEPAVRGNLPATAFRTAPLGYVRFHGRNRRDWWPRISRQRAEELRRRISQESPEPSRRLPRERHLAQTLERQKARRYNYLYTQTEFDGWRERIELINQGAEATYLVTNNHYLGQAVANAKMLQGMFDLSVAGPNPPAIAELLAAGAAEARGAPRPDPEWAQMLAELEG